ncbi:lyase family protein [Pannonibacter sp. Pt2-lr]
MEAKLAERLGLTVSPVPWHVSRDGLMEFAGWCALVTGSLGKIGQDIALLSQNEIGELRPGSGGGSSTMPNKANPVGAEVLIALARYTGGQLGTLQQAAIAEYERSGAAWLIEWLSLPQIAAATGKALTTAASLLDSLVIDTARMRANIEASNGLLLAEAASFALAATMPRPQAQDLVKKACATVLSSGTHLFDVLAAMTPVPADWSALKDPALHMGESAALIDRIVESAQALGLES